MYLRKFGLICLLLLLSGAAVRAAEPEAPTVLVVPARYTIVQFAFDILQLRPVSLVAYEAEKADAAAPVLHIWNTKEHDWIRARLGEYSTGGIFASTPKTAILVGSDEDLPAPMIDASRELGAEIVRIPTLKLASLANKLNESMRFTAAEWKWLAARHRLAIKDLNEDRRRYGKYRPPSRKKQ